MTTIGFKNIKNMLYSSSAQVLLKIDSIVEDRLDGI